MSDYRFRPTIEAMLERPTVEVFEPEEGAAEIDLPADASSLDFLQAIYRSADQPMTRRMRAAIAALPHEVPKLAVVATMGAGKDFAAQLEAALARSKVINGRVLAPEVLEPPRG